MTNKISAYLHALVLCACTAFGGQAWAQAQPQPAPANPSEVTQAQRQVEQPGNNSPVWRDVRSGADNNYSTVKSPEAGVLIQPSAKFPGQELMYTAGESWRNYRNGPITFIGGLLIVFVAAAIGVFYLWKGQIKLKDAPTGRLIPRFSVIERWAHWSMAISFCVLGVSGLVILFGKHVLLPVIGYTLFAWLTMLMKYLHNFIGPLFIVSIVLFAIIYVRHNLPAADDIKWLAKGGGLLTGEHVPSGRFNAGEKSWFWLGVVVLGTVVSVSGLILLFPNFEQLRTTMQQANVVHGIGGVIFIALSLGHIYVGTIGMQGAYEGMRTGYVDEVWAKEHHEHWYNEVKSGAGPQPTGTSSVTPAAQV